MGATAEAGDDDTRVIKFLVGSRRLGKFSYTWRIGSGGTSFYIKPLPAALQEIKVSLHGPDSARGLTGGYKIELDESAGSTQQDAGALTKLVNWPQRRWFGGHEVLPGVDLVVRLRFPWDLFDAQAVSAQPPPRGPRAREFGGLIPTPARGHAADVDVFVCRDEPYWPNEEQSRRDNANLGPIKNKAGQYLTAQVVHRHIEQEPSPVAGSAPVGPLGAPPVFDRLRGLGAAFDDTAEFLWLEEMWLSRSEMQREALSIFRAPS
ncbi:hypothetical protein [Blastococcus sp. TF02A-35]|uniref:hypothetical protein n=1 Tax=Blastococcus sp. TF02A-35 TaxID=2559612 RepID=UPI001074621D|nr:hypothetical protein [Blastococcus sp. TF02A_35]TFV44880.1 hypothetical protein E4P43_18245 [Blastococcus sp. TF02A_35]